MTAAEQDSRLLRFLYRTVPGRALLKPLTAPVVSRLAGRVLSSRLSRRAVPGFIRRHGIEMDGVIVPEGGFPSFNAFFTRRREWSGVLPLPGQMICPCDGLLQVIPVGEDTRLEIKGNPYLVGQLLKDDRLADVFRGGAALVFRLTPQHYHRYCYCTGGTVLADRRIPGKLHCVRPVALCSVPVFAHNSREYQVIRRALGTVVVQMEVGALMVGRITNEGAAPGEPVRAGQEKGYFEFGGSTIIVLVTKADALYVKRLADLSRGEGERPVRMGEPL